MLTLKTIIVMFLLSFAAVGCNSNTTTSTEEQSPALDVSTPLTVDGEVSQTVVNDAVQPVLSSSTNDTTSSSLTPPTPTETLPTTNLNGTGTDTIVTSPVDVQLPPPEDDDC